jgi:hypothetical protein
MTDSTLTIKKIKASKDAFIEHRIAGAAILAGDLLYDVSESDCTVVPLLNERTFSARLYVGIALEPAAPGQKVDCVYADYHLTIEADKTFDGEVLAATAAGIMPVDEASNDGYLDVLILGAMTQTGHFKLMPIAAKLF